MRGIWKGKSVEYTPGRVMVGIRNASDLARLIGLIENAGGKIDYISTNTIDVLVEPRNTLEIAAKLDGIGDFRFATPEIRPERNSKY